MIILFSDAIINNFVGVFTREHTTDRVSNMDFLKDNLFMDITHVSRIGILSIASVQLKEIEI